MLEKTSNSKDFLVIYTFRKIVMREQAPVFESGTLASERFHAASAQESKIEHDLLPEEFSQLVVGGVHLPGDVVQSAGRIHPKLVDRSEPVAQI